MMDQADSSPSRRSVRARLLAALGLALLACVGGCEEAGSSATEDMLNAWRQAGLMPAVFTKLESDDLRPGTCQQGKVDGVSVVLCEYADAAAARAAHNTGLAQVGESTGLAIAAGKLLLIVSDPDKSDPEGRKINAIATAFRDTHAPEKPATEGEAKAEGESAGKNGKAADEPAAAGKNK